jgi:hypothetical protein
MSDHNPPRKRQKQNTTATGHNAKDSQEESSNDDVNAATKLERYLEKRGLQAHYYSQAIVDYRATGWALQIDGWI